MVFLSGNRDSVEGGVGAKQGEIRGLECMWVTLSDKVPHPPFCSLLSGLKGKKVGGAALS